MNKDPCIKCNGIPKRPISTEERDALVSLSKLLPYNICCDDCGATGLESIRLSREKRKNDKNGK